MHIPAPPSPATPSLVDSFPSMGMAIIIVPAGMPRVRPILPKLVLSEAQERSRSNGTWTEISLR
jgi:hypothetical protein